MLVAIKLTTKLKGWVGKGGEALSISAKCVELGIACASASMSAWYSSHFWEVTPLRGEQEEG